MSDTKYLQCRACSREFIDIDDGMFVTCRRCRVADTKIRKAPVFNTGGRAGRPQECRENTYETKYGIDY